MSHSWSVLPLAARGVVSRGLGADQQSFWATRTRSGAFVLADADQGLRASLAAGQLELTSASGLRLGLSAPTLGRRGDLTEVAPGAGSAQRNRVVFAAGSVSEWFANGPLGIEQGFTVARRPAGSGPLIISQRLSGDSRGEVQAGAQGVRFRSRGGSVQYGQLLVTDASGRKVPARLSVAGGRLEITVSDRVARYPLRVDPVFHQIAELTASDGAAEDYLGYPSVAISGSTIVAAGDYHTVDGHAAQGAIYVYEEPAKGGWANAKQTAELTASNGFADDYLGYTGVAISGSTIAADDAYQTVGSNTLQGAVYVWTMPKDRWRNEHSPEVSQSAELTASDGAGSDYLGYDSELLVSGSTIATAAYYHDSDKGAVYVWTEPKGGWGKAHFPMKQTAELTASDGAADDYLGYTGLAMSGSTIVGGAYGHEVAGHGDAGAVYVWSQPKGGWGKAHFPMKQTAELVASNASADTYLGYTGSGSAVAISGSTIASVASYRTVGGNADQGAAYVWKMPKGGWGKAHFPMESTAELTASNGAADDYLGYDSSIAISGSTVVTAAPYHNSKAGEVYAWTMPKKGWAKAPAPMHSTAALAPSGLDTEAYLGYPAVVFSGSSVVAPAYDQEVGSHSEQGAVYLWKMPTRGWKSGPQTAEFTASNGVTDGYLGYETPIVTSGPNILVDADYQPVGSNSEQGALYVFRVPVKPSGVRLSLSRARTMADGKSSVTATFTVHDTTGAAVAGDQIEIKVTGKHKVSAVEPGSTPGTYRATITSAAGAKAAKVTATDVSVKPSVSATAKLAATPKRRR